MDLRHARTFVTVAELGTVSKAAERLHTAQPALSRQISHLEQELDLKLFDRVGRRLVLTGEGEQLLGDCRSLLSCASALAERHWDEHRGVYVDCVDPATGAQDPRVSQHANAALILWDVAPRSRWASMVRFITDPARIMASATVNA